jgi:Na+/phosphate symporter
MIQQHVDKEDSTAIIKTKITHDFVLDVYEKSLSEEDPVARQSIIEAAKVLSESIGDYLVEND